MRRGIVFATDVLEPLIDLTIEAEREGFDRVWTTEYRGRDAIARALALLLNTQRIEVGTGVAYAFSRLPLAMAALASDVQRLSKGRFGLGLSPGTRGVRGWFGAEFEPPAPALTQYVEQVREIWGKSSEYAQPKIYLPAFNSIMTRHASRVADGLVLHPLAAGSTHFEERVLPAIRRGSSEREALPELVSWQITSIDADEAEAHRRAAAQLAFYFSTPSYRIAAEGTPWESIPELINEEFQRQDPRNPDWNSITRHVPDSMIDEFVLWGTPESVRSRLPQVEAGLREKGISETVYQTVGTGLSEAEVVDNCSAIISVIGEMNDEGKRTKDV